jgi:MFS family permease
VSRDEGAEARFPWTFPLAFFGAHLAFMPVLVLLLPRRVEAIAGGEAPLALGWLLLAGALAASVGHILAGHWSDRWIARHGSRRGLIALGLGALLASFGLLAAAGTVAEAAAALVAFQLALNLAFAPLGALLPDYVPDAAKGRVAGLMSAALPLSLPGIAVLAWLFPHDSDTAFLVNGLLVGACMAPLLIRWGFGRPLASSVPAATGRPTAPAEGRFDFAWTWVARFLVQLGAAFVLGFLFLLISDRIAADPQWAGPRNASQAMALLSLGGAFVGVIGAVLGGRASDGVRARRVPLAISAGVLAASLAVLGARLPWPLFLAGYALFQLALCAFLAIGLAVFAQLVGQSPRRGALLGVVNLSNTFPAILAPAIAIASLGTGLIEDRLGLLFIASSAAAACAGVAALRIRGVR